VWGAGLWGGISDWALVAKFLMWEGRKEKNWIILKKSDK
jgi:hypothetical protein